MCKMLENQIVRDISEQLLLVSEEVFTAYLKIRLQKLCFCHFLHRQYVVCDICFCLCLLRIDYLE
jgi:hypothetical protein